MSRPLALFLTTSYPRGPGDASGLFVAGLARAFVHQGWSVEVLAPGFRKPRACAAEAATEIPGCDGLQRTSAMERELLRVERLSYGLGPGSQRLFYGAGALENLCASPGLLRQAPIFLGRLAWRARRLARRARLVLGHWLVPGGLVAARASGGTRCATICHSGGLWLLEQLPGRRALASYLLRRCHRLLFVAEHLRARFGALLPYELQPRLRARSVVMPMGVDAPLPPSADERKQARSRLGLGPGPVLLFLGRFVPIKGLGALLRAAQGLDLELVLAGGGPEEQELIDLARGLGLRCLFPGWVTGHVKDDLLQAAEGLVLPSRELLGRVEGAPVAAMEGLAAGLPVIASAVGGLPELVRHGRCGLLLPGSPGQHHVAWREALALPGQHPERWEELCRGAAASGTAFRWKELGPRLVRALQGDPSGVEP